jgi:hypothetical protein
MTLLILESGLFADNGLLGETVGEASFDISDPSREDAFWDDVIRALHDADEVITL